MGLARFTLLFCSYPPPFLLHVSSGVVDCTWIVTYHWLIHTAGLVAAWSLWKRAASRRGLGRFSERRVGIGTIGNTPNGGDWSSSVKTGTTRGTRQGKRFFQFELEHRADVIYAWRAVDLKNLDGRETGASGGALTYEKSGVISHWGRREPNG